MSKRDERGVSLSVWACLVIPAFILMIGVGVDFSGHAKAQQEARATAGEAARVGAQRTDIERVAKALNRLAAVEAAEQFGRAAGYAASATADDEGVQVTLSGKYHTRFLGLIGINEIKFEASRSASYAQISDGAETP